MVLNVQCISVTTGRDLDAWLASTLPVLGLYKLSSALLERADWHTVFIQSNQAMLQVSKDSIREFLQVDIVLPAEEWRHHAVNPKH